MYKTNKYHRLLPNLDLEYFVEIVARNGKTIAECSTQAMADKIVKGLELYDEAEIVKKAFRL